MKLRIKLFQDGAELPKMIDARKRGLVDGFTTNPTLMRKAGVSDYREFAHRRSPPSPTCRFRSRYSPTISKRWSARRARSRAGAATPTSKFRSPTPRANRPAPLIRKLSAEGFSLNVTADLTLDQVETVASAASPEVPHHRLGVRRPDRRHRRRSRAGDDRGGRHTERSAPRRAPLGEPARGAQRGAGGSTAAATSSPRRLT